MAALPTGYLIVVNPNYEIPQGEGCGYRMCEPVGTPEEIDKMLISMAKACGVLGEVHVLKCVRKLVIEPTIKEIR